MRADEFDAPRVDRLLAWSIVAAFHALLAFAASHLYLPASRDGESEPLALIFLPPPSALPPPAPLPARPRTAPARSAPTGSGPTAPPSRTRAASATSPKAAALDSGLTAVQMPPSASPPQPHSARAPWDAPTADLLERRAPTLPGHATQRFKMQQPRSLATAVERFGQLFGGRGEDPCKRTRANIDGLASQGDSADLQRELEYERRYCRP